MAKQNKLKFVALCMILIMILAACSNNGNNNGSNSPNPSANNTDTEVKQPEQTEPAAEKKGIAFPLEEKVTLTAFANRTPAGKDYNEKAFFKTLEEETNVHIEWDLAVQPSLAERRNLLLASDDLPDIFYGSGVLGKDDVLRAAAQGQIVPIDGMIEEYAPNLHKLLEARPEYRKSITASDGHIYTVPLIFEEQNNTAPDAMFINKEWLDQLGLSMPTTTEEFHEVLKAFKTEDPNGNGQADELPLSFRYQSAKNPNRLYGNSSLSGAFGPIDQKAEGHLSIENGEVSFVPVTEGYKEYAKYMKSLHEDGLIDVESFTQDYPVYKSKVTADTPVVGAFFEWTLVDIFGEGETPYVPLPPLKGPTGHQEWNKANIRIEIGSFAISSENEHPELSLAWMDQMLTETRSFESFWGPFGINLEKNADGTIEYLPTPEGMNYGEFRHNESPAVRGVPILYSEMLDKVVPNASYTEKRELLNIYKPYQTKEIFPVMLKTIEESEALALITPDIHNFVEDKLAQWIFNGNIDAEWDAYVEQLNKMQLEEYVEIHQGIMDRYNNNN